MIRRHLLWVMFVFHFDPLGSRRFVKILFYIIETGGRDWISTPTRDNVVVATMSEVLFLFKCWLGHKYLNCFGMQKFAAGRPKCKHSKWKKGFLVKGGLPFDVGLIHVLKRLFLRNVRRLAFLPSLSETSSFRNQWGFDLHIWNTWVSLLIKVSLSTSWTYLARKMVVFLMNLYLSSLGNSSPKVAVFFLFLEKMHPKVRKVQGKK